MTRHIVKLSYPVQHGGATTEELSFRRPKVRDLRVLTDGKGSETDRSMTLIASLAEIDPDVLDELDPVDFAAINDWLEPIIDPKKKAAE